MRTATPLILFIALLSLANVVLAGDIDAVRATVFAWSKARQNGDFNRYLSFYSPAFQSEEGDHETWKQKRAAAFQDTDRIRMEIFDLSVFVEGKYATARFIQHYNAPNFTDTGEKTLILVNSGHSWRIVSEKWRPLSAPKPPAKSKKQKPRGIIKRVAPREITQPPFAAEEKIRPKESKPPVTVQKAIPHEASKPPITATKDIRPEEPKPSADHKQTALNKKKAEKIEERYPEFQPANQKAQKSEINGFKPVKTTVKSITFDIDRHLEKVFVRLNQFVIPRTLTLGGDKPRIVLDIMNVSSWKGPSKIPVNGKIIRRIRTYLHQEIQKLRIVLDLMPAKDYIIDQTFNQAQNTYGITVQHNQF